MSFFALKTRDKERAVMRRTIAYVLIVTAFATSSIGCTYARTPQVTIKPSYSYRQQQISRGPDGFDAAGPWSIVQVAEHSSRVLPQP